MDIHRGARIIVEEWIQASREEVLYFITDENHKEEAEAFRIAAETSGAIPKITFLPKDHIQQGDILEEVQHIMSYSDVVIGATDYSFITTNAVDFALQRGARFLSMPLHTNDGSSIFASDFIRMNPRRAAQIAKPMLKALRSTDTIHVTTPNGTDIRFNKKDRKTGLFHGVTSRRRSIGSSSFEVYVPIIEDSAEGTVILDGSMGYIGLVEAPLELRFERGRLAFIEPTADGERLKNYILSFRDEALFSASEFGIGLNEISRCRGISYIEDESTFGTFHIGFGRNLALGGTLDAAGHFDIVIHNPTIFTDSQTVMVDGHVIDTSIF